MLIDPNAAAALTALALTLGCDPDRVDDVVQRFVKTVSPVGSPSYFVWGMRQAIAAEDAAL